MIEERGYICRLEESEIFSFTVEAVRLMNRKGFKVIGITNQAAVARGICTCEEVETIHEEITKSLAKEGAVIDKFYYCPYHPEGKVPEYRRRSDCRKPEPGMILQAAKDFDLDLSRSYMIGDDLIDVAAGKNAGCRTVLVLTGKGREMMEKAAAEGLHPGTVTENILTFIKELQE